MLDAIKDDHVQACIVAQMAKTEGIKQIKKERLLCSGKESTEVKLKVIKEVEKKQMIMRWK